MSSWRLAIVRMYSSFSEMPSPFPFGVSFSFSPKRFNVFRDNSADAVLFVSVLHHLSTPTRRKAALAGEIPSSHLSIPSFRGYPLSKSGRTPVDLCLGLRAAECLVPLAGCPRPLATPRAEYKWSVCPRLDDSPSKSLGRLPQVKFHVNSTKEQRIIEVVLVGGGRRSVRF